MISSLHRSLASCWHEPVDNFGLWLASSECFKYEYLSIDILPNFSHWHNFHKILKFSSSHIYFQSGARSCLEGFEAHAETNLNIYPTPTFSPLFSVWSVTGNGGKIQSKQILNDFMQIWGRRCTSSSASFYYQHMLCYCTNSTKASGEMDKEELTHHAKVLLRLFLFLCCFIHFWWWWLAVIQIKYLEIISWGCINDTL